MRNTKLLFVFIVIFTVIFTSSFPQTSYQDDAMAQYYTGRDAYNSGNYKDAQYYFQRALILDPKIEAMAQNIKFWLGISAFNNGDFKTARVNLELFPNAPIAVDLLKKIVEIEKNADDYYFLNTDIYDERNYSEITPSVQATQTETESGGGVNLIIILTVVWLAVLAVSVLFEMKFGFFSKVALSLVKRGSLKTSSLDIEVKTPDSGQYTSNEEKNESEEIADDIPRALFDTPFEEEIDIDSMASRDIEEISRYFDEGLEEKEEKESFIDDVRMRMKEKKSKEAAKNDAETEPVKSEMSVREQILQSASEGYQNDDIDAEYKDDSENISVNGETPINIEEMEFDEENIGDLEDIDELSFDEELFIKKTFELIEQAEKKAVSASEPEEEWKTIDELTKNLEESEKNKDLNYYENMKEMSDEQREDFFNFLFEKVS